MTNIFSVEESQEKQLLGEKFVVRRISDETLNEQMEINKEAQKYSQGPLVSRPLNYIKMVAYFIGLACVFILFGQAGTLQEKVKTTAGLVSCLVGIAAFVVGIFIQSKQNRDFRVFQQTKSKELREKSLKLVKKSFDELGVPEDSLHLDTIFHLYSMNDAVPASKNGSTNYNVSLCYFQEGDNLCIGNIEKVLSIPIKSIVGTEKKDLKCKFYGWNKAVEYNSSEMYPYGIKRAGFGFYTVSSYMTVKILDEGEEYTIEILPYDATKFENFLKEIQASEN